MQRPGTINKKSMKIILKNLLPLNFFIFFTLFSCGNLTGFTKNLFIAYSKGK